MHWSAFGGPTAEGDGVFYYDVKNQLPFVRHEVVVHVSLQGAYSCFGQQRYRRMTSTFSEPIPEPWNDPQDVTDRRFGCERVYWYGGTQHRYYRPRSVYFGNQVIFHARWYSWGTLVARGRGTYPYNDCKPYCAVGHITTYPVLVRLSRIDLCNGDLAYGRLRYHFPGRKPPLGPRTFTIGVQRACDF
jgi:hypothetical protein